MRELAEFIRGGHKFAVISHISPDGDTMGCAAALVLALEKTGRECQWFCEGEIPGEFMNFRAIAHLTEKKNIHGFDSVICVDCSDRERLGNCAERFDSIPRKAQLDHHRTNTRFADVNVVQDRNAACFLVLELLSLLEIPLDDDIAQALFIGITTDTGRLSHSGITAQDVQETAALYEYAIRPDRVVGILFATHTLTQVQLRGRAIEHLRTRGRITYTYLLQKDYAEFSAASSDSEGVVEICRSVEGTQFAVFLREKPDGGFKVSMRCEPGFDVAATAACFGGGGHILAAGCNVDGPVEDAMEQVLAKIGEQLA